MFASRRKEPPPSASQFNKFWDTARVGCGTRRVGSRPVRDGELHEIRSPLILQPGRTALTDGLQALHAIFRRWSTKANRQASRPRTVLVSLSQPPSPEQAERYGVRAVMRSTDTSTASLDALRDLIERGVLVVPSVGGVYPLAEVPRVWSEVAAGTFKGQDCV